METESQEDRGTGEEKQRGDSLSQEDGVGAVKCSDQSVSTTVLSSSHSDEISHLSLQHATGGKIVQSQTHLESDEDREQNGLEPSDGLSHGHLERSESRPSTASEGGAQGQTGDAGGAALQRSLHQHTVEVLDDLKHAAESFPMECSAESVVAIPASLPQNVEMVPGGENATSEGCHADGTSDLSGESEVEAHVQNICMKDLSELFAHDDTVSVVIITEDGDPVEWLRQSDIIMEKETDIECGSMKSSDSCGSESEVNFKYASVAASHDPGCVDPVVCAVESIPQDKNDNVTDVTGGSGRRKRSSDSPNSHFPSKIQRLSPAVGRLSSHVHGSSEHGDSDSTMDVDESVHQINTQTRESHIVVNTSCSSAKSSSSEVKPTSIKISHSPSTSIHTTPALTVTTKGSVDTVKQAHTSSTHLVQIFPQTLADGKEISTANDETRASTRDTTGRTMTASPEKTTLLKSETKLIDGSSVSSGDGNEVKASASSSGVHVIDTNMVYRCAECDYASSNKHYYKQHVDLVHKTARPFKCPFCDYAGKRGHALREHLIVHSMEKPFSCNHCNATFRKKAHLTSHTKLHSVKYSRGSDVIKVGADPRSSGHLVVFARATGTSMKLAPASAEMVVKEAAAPKLVKSEAGVTGASPKTSVPTFWCSLCKQAMADANAFQIHLQSVHHLFACEKCDLVVPDKSALLAHLPTHGTTSSGDPGQPPVPVAVTPVPVAVTPVPVAVTPVPVAATAVSVACKPIYSCTECNFTTPSMNVLRAHAVTHTTGPAPSSMTPAPAKDQQRQAQQPPQQASVSKVICSECGLVADNAEVMRAHMWTHISKNTEVKDKASIAVTEVQQVAPGAGSSSVMRVIPGSATGVKTLPQNAAFKCTECSYTSRDVSLFVKHMLLHKARQKPILVNKMNQAPVTSTQVQADEPASDRTITLPVGSNGKSSHLYQVKPVTTENTCKNTDTSPFVHDTATGRFRCTICGYTCEYQRTIKAHIWKHSGHHQVDYPIFQNGPLSVYEDPVPVPVKVIELNPASSPVSAKNQDTLLPSVSSKTQGSVQGSQAIPANTTPDKGAVPTRIAVPIPGSMRLVPGLKIDRVTDLKAQLPGGSSPSKLSITASPSSRQQLPADAAGKHLIVHVRSGLTDSRPVPGGNVHIKQEPVVMVGRDDVKTSLAGKKLPVAKTELVQGGAKSSSKEIPRVSVQNVETSAGVAVDEVTKVQPASLQAKTLTSTSTLVDDGPSQAVLSKFPKARSDMLTPVTTDASSSTSSASMATSVITSKSLSVTPSIRPAQGDGITQRVESSSVKQDIHIKQESITAEDEQHSVKAAANSDDQTLITQPTVHQVAHSTTGGNAGDVRSHMTAGLRKRSSQDEDSRLTDSQAQEKSRADENVNEVLSSSKPNVVVEAVPRVATGTSLTGLHVRSSSPRVLRSQTSSPVTVSAQQSHPSAVHKDTVPKPTADAVEIETVGAVKETLVPEDSRVKTNDANPEDGISRSEASKDLGGSHEGHPTDSESAVTLLSLLKRGPNFNPACPQGTSGATNTGPAPDNFAAHQSPDRPPSTGSESDSKGVSIGDQASEDTASEVESTVSGKSRGGTGGICSSLLAVIEQLRERSRSESDAEDKSALPQPKKRAVRRRGRRESQEEALGPEDGDNIETLVGEDSVTYRCKLCHYTSTRTPLIRLHMRTHRQKDPFECSLCPLVTESSEALQEHMIQHCKVRTYPCKFCPQSFNHKSTLRAHMRAHNDSEPFLCDLCEFETSNPLEYRTHMQKHSGMALLQCPNCPTLVASYSDLQSHVAKGCSARGQQGQSHDGWQKDMAAEGSAHRERLVCSQCEFSAPDVAGLREHMVANHAYGAGAGLNAEDTGCLLQCTLCEFTAVSSRSLKSHMKRHANDQRYVQQPLEQYKCALCGYVCHHLPSLKSHMWRHASDQNYSYQFTNDVINAAIDYDTRVDLVPASSGKSSGDEEPELLERFLSAERRIMEGQLSKMVAKGTNPLCWVTFRCCQCGFETINKAKLNLHMRTHADIINRTLKVKVESSSADSQAVEEEEADKVKMEVVYEPV